MEYEGMCPRFNQKGQKNRWSIEVDEWAINLYCKFDDVDIFSIP